MSSLEWASISTPVGPVSVGYGDAGVAQARFGPSPGGRSPDGQPAAPASPATAAARQLAEYFCGQRRDFDLPVDWSAFGPAQRQVLRLLYDDVRYGQTVTYGILAVRAGLEGAADAIPARMVGQIMGSNPIPIIVPCHRVVASDGLGGYSGGAGPEVKRWLLILEGSLPPTLDWTPAQPPES
ncbi:MAG TPA: methylated-DNA--[protein]-cysteine S-methyltransferase [Streptosporangiaceae bacterium]|jgi:methylated-DNA-[protein]-cysteine S-methyltransferase|nr:methylated-DNA--[protein]-cysteine S-methyltransferase [Streptosporangiaceae bacterium]